MSLRLTMSIIVLSLIVFPAAVIAAEKIFRSTDAEGNVVFSDTGSIDAVEVQITETSIFTTVKENKPVAVYDDLLESEEEQYSIPPYSHLSIDSPQDDAAIRDNAGNLEVRFSVIPSLHEAHSVQLMMDGSLSGSSKGARSFSLANLDRGTHQLLVQIVDDESGEVIRASEAVSVSILRHQRPRPSH